MTRSNADARESVILHHVTARPDSKAIDDWRERFRGIRELLRLRLQTHADPAGLAARRTSAADSHDVE